MCFLWVSAMILLLSFSPSSCVALSIVVYLGFYISDVGVTGREVLG